MPTPTGNPVTSLPAKAAPVLAQQFFETQWYQFFASVKRVLSPGISTKVALAKLTVGGANGSLTVVNGIITGYVAPT